MKSSAFLGCCLAIFLGACAEERFTGRPGLQVVQGSAELPAPEVVDLIQEQRAYVIGPFDRVAVDVYGVPDLSRTVQVDASGNIALPLAGVVAASGKTPSQIAAAIADRLRGRYVRNPEVTVNTDATAQTFTVDGEVNAPGQFPVTGRMTLMRAVARAQGVTEFANTNYVVVFRTVGGRQYAALYDLRAVRSGAYADPEIYANDVVLVNESRGRRLFQLVIATSPLLSAPLIALLN